MNKKIYYKGIVCLLLVPMLLLTGFGCRNDGKINEIIKIKMWGVFDNSNEIYPFIKSYEANYPNIQIDYQKKMFSEYEDILLNGLSDDTGPDIFVIHNTWLPKYKSKITPIPEDMFQLNEFRESFVSVAEDDLVDEDKIYSLPLYIDTLAMYYNFDHYRLTKNGRPSDNWADFSEDIKRLNIFNQGTNDFDRTAIALGTENNVNQAIDVLYQLFLQYNASFYNTDLTKATFSNKNGLNAFMQFLSYADKDNPNYSWNHLRENDIYEFVSGKVSTIIGYSYLYDQLAAQSRTKGLDFRVAKIPQVNPSVPVTYADYWSYTVKKNDDPENQKVRHSWNFIKSMTSEESARSYFEMTHRPTARKALIEEQEKDMQFGVFVNQVRYAKSIKNYDRDKYQLLLEKAIEMVREEGVSPSKALNQAQEGISKIISAYNEI